MSADSAAVPEFPPGQRRITLWSALLLVALAVLATYRENLGFHLLGNDTLPVIVSSRVESLAELPSLFTKRLMEGVIQLDYWRPIQNVTFALDWALWELDPFGYQLSDLFLFLGAAMALFLLARRLLGTSSIAGPLVVALLFVWFPMQAEIVPVPSRRNHTLCCLFMALSLAAMIRGRERTGLRAAIPPALFALLAMGSNEIALCLPAIVFLVALLLPEGRAVGAAERVRSAAVASLPAVAAFAVAIFARWQIQGSLSGPRPPGLANLDVSAELLGFVLYPRSALEGSALWNLLLATVLAAVVALAVLVLRGSTSERSASTEAPAWIRTVLAGLAWTLVVSLLIASVGRIRLWYPMHPVAGLALAAGGLAQGAVHQLAASRGLPARLVGALTLAALLGVLGVQAAHSPMVHPLDQWERGSDQMRAFLADLEKRIPLTPDGQVLRSKPVPVRARPRPGKAGSGRVFAPSLLGPNSVRAWVRLRSFDRPIEVSLSNEEPGLPPPDGILLVLNVD